MCRIYAWSERYQPSALCVNLTSQGGFLESLASAATDRGTLRRGTLR